MCIQKRNDSQYIEYMYVLHALEKEDRYQEKSQ